MHYAGTKYLYGKITVFIVVCVSSVTLCGANLFLEKPFKSLFHISSMFLITYRDCIGYFN